MIRKLMPQKFCVRAVNGARKLDPQGPIARINPALKLKPRETSLKLQPEQSRPLLAPFNVAFVPVPPIKKAMGTVLVLLKREEGR